MQSKAVLVVIAMTAVLIVQLVPINRSLEAQDVVVRELPRAVHRVVPDFNNALITVSVLVLPDGTVDSSSVEVTASELDRRAIAAARQWRFKPALDERGDSTAIMIVIPFRVRTGTGK